MTYEVKNYNLKEKPDDKKTSRLRILLNILQPKVFYSIISV